MITFKEYLEEMKKDPCWKGYEMVGVKDKNGKKVPNCVPKNEERECQCEKDCECEEGYVSDAQRKAVWASRNEKGIKEEQVDEAAIDAKGHKSSTGGLTQKGVDAYRRENPGSKLQTAVTTKPSKLKKGSKAWNRRKSFCARMSGVEGPMKDEDGKPTRKALALRKWNC